MISKTGVKDDRVEENHAIHKKCRVGYLRDHPDAVADEGESAGILDLRANNELAG